MSILNLEIVSRELANSESIDEFRGVTFNLLCFRQLFVFVVVAMERQRHALAGSWGIAGRVDKCDRAEDSEDSFGCTEVPVGNYERTAVLVGDYYHYL